MCKVIRRPATCQYPSQLAVNPAKREQNLFFKIIVDNASEGSIDYSVLSKYFTGSQKKFSKPHYPH
jgi:hypothetical protein